MVILIAGTSHTGKTCYAQKLLEKHHYPYLSIDHLKMGLIRSGLTQLTPMDDEALTDLLWPIVREMVKTAIENKQNLIVEGCYIPFHWQKDLEPVYLEQIQYVCLVMSRQYIEAHFDDIRTFASVIECRLDDSGLSKEELIEDNERNLAACIAGGLPYILIEEPYGSWYPHLPQTNTLKEDVWRILQTIPAGKVMTYSQIAELLGNKQLARTVGNILHSNPDPTHFPCHRVVNAQGRPAEHYAFGGAAAQRAKLEAEGVVFLPSGKVDLKKYSFTR